MFENRARCFKDVAVVIFIIIVIVSVIIYIENDADRYLDVGFENFGFCLEEASFEIHGKRLTLICDGRKIHKEKVTDTDVYEPLLDVELSTDDDKTLVFESIYLGNNKFFLTYIWYEDYSLLKSVCWYSNFGDCPHHILVWANPKSPFHDFKVGDTVYLTTKNLGSHTESIPEGEEATVLSLSRIAKDQVVLVRFTESGKEDTYPYEWLTHDKPKK